MTPPLFLTELEEDEEKDLKKVEGWMDGSLNAVISRTPVELINFVRLWLWSCPQQHRTSLRTLMVPMLLVKCMSLD